MRTRGIPSIAFSLSLYLTWRVGVDRLSNKKGYGLAPLERFSSFKTRAEEHETLVFLLSLSFSHTCIF